MSIIPRRVEYAGPESWTVWTDEDGVHLRSPKGECLESGDVQRLITLITEANLQHTAGEIPAPRPPSAEERNARYGRYGRERDEYEAKRAARAVYGVLAPTTTDQPF